MIMGETPQTAMTTRAPVVLNNDDFYTIVKVGAVYLLVLHPHHADRDHLVDLLPPPLHILPVQVWQDQQPHPPSMISLRTALLVTVFLLLINIFSGIIELADDIYSRSDLVF